jgi:hypothetical protein
MKYTTTKYLNRISGSFEVLGVVGEMSRGEIPVALRAPSISPRPLNFKTLDRKEKQV